MKVQVCSSGVFPTVVRLFFYKPQSQPLNRKTFKFPAVVLRPFIFKEKKLFH